MSSAYFRAAWVVFLGISLGLSAEVAADERPIREPKLPVSIEEAAQMLLVRFDGIVYAEVDSLQVRPITKAAGYCVVVTELYLQLLDHPVQMSRGPWTVLSSMTPHGLLVQTLSLPESFLSSPPAELDRCTLASGDVPPPAVGSRGLFFLYKPGARSISLHKIFMPSVRYGFAPTPGDSATVYLEPRANWYTWPVSDLLRALDAGSQVK
jgi:hypothetical protein